MSALDQFRTYRRKKIKKLGKRLIRAVSRFIAQQSLIGDEPVFDKNVFPFTAEFEANWQKIRTELDGILQHQDALPAFHELSPDQHRISKGDNWKTFVFYGFGYRVDDNCLRCPETARLLDAVPHIENAWFSILAPGYHIPPHKGPTNGIIRIHLGLMVPKARERCHIRVDDRILHWDEGKCIVFNDYFEHEVKNDTDETRVVLFFDVDRPLRPLGRLVNNLLNAIIRRSAYVQDAKKNMRDWKPVADA
ncbi:MAG: aspartyl beta-hydroxylase [Gammaproteobacteria bacterium HGW-Gammaproteobacteria-3]|jgi:beta-hydroxylase|nr:MAG: aspartyl beta-hydroxylase [Gammaproteobacteria bacterium HGW-Gammaproteobacteria-3]